jgi:hypothetical protein
VAHLSIRLPERTLARFDALAHECGLTRARLLRQLIDGALSGVAVEAPESPSEVELLELLAERARLGNVAAIRTLLIREEERDPRARALALLQDMAEARRQ